MSTRATVYLHRPDEENVLKLYHHRDWYVEYLGVKLDNALKSRKRQVEKNDYKKPWNILKNIVNIWGFEPTKYIHWDVEYVYHITYTVNNEYIDWKHKVVASYILDWQAWYDENEILKKTKVLLSCKWKRGDKKLNRKQAEKDLWQASHYIDWYLD